MIQLVCQLCKEGVHPLTKGARGWIHVTAPNEMTPCEYPNVLLDKIQELQTELAAARQRLHKTELERDTSAVINERLNRELAKAETKKS